MNQLLTISLIFHVFFGLVGVIASYIAWVLLLRPQPNLRLLQISSFKSFLFLVLSWLAGGYYYVNYYGGTVKPIIKAGPFPWAHSFLMESKEHIFLFLPFLALVVFLVSFLCGEKLMAGSGCKKPLAWLAGLVFVLGVFVALAGVLISGAAR